MVHKNLKNTITYLKTCSEDQNFILCDEIYFTNYFPAESDKRKWQKCPTIPRRGVQSPILCNSQFWLVEAFLIMQLRYEHDAIIMAGAFAILNCMPGDFRAWFISSSISKSDSAAGQESTWRCSTRYSPFSLLYRLKSLIFFSTISLFWSKKDGRLWRRCWLGWSSCMLTSVFVHHMLNFFSCFCQISYWIMQWR